MHLKRVICLLFVTGNLVASDLSGLRLPDKYAVGRNVFDISKKHIDILSESKILKRHLKRVGTDLVINEDGAVRDSFYNLMILSWLSKTDLEASQEIARVVTDLSDHSLAIMINMADKYNHPLLLELLTTVAVPRLQNNHQNSSPLVTHTANWAGDIIRRSLTAQIGIGNFFDEHYQAVQFLKTNTVSLLALAHYKNHIAWVWADGGTCLKRISTSDDDFKHYPWGLTDGVSVGLDNPTPIVDLVSGDKGGLLLFNQDGAVNYFKPGNLPSRGSPADYTIDSNQELACVDMCEETGWIVGGKNNGIIFFDIKRMKRERAQQKEVTFDAVGKINKVKMCSDENRIAFSCNEGLSLYDIETGKSICSYPITHKVWDCMERGIFLLQEGEDAILYDHRQKEPANHIVSEVTNPKALRYFDGKFCIIGQPRIDVRDIRFSKPFFSLCGKSAVWNKQTIGGQQKGTLFVGTDAGVTKIDGRVWNITEDIWKTDRIESALAVDSATRILEDRKQVPQDVLKRTPHAIQCIIQQKNRENSYLGSALNGLRRFIEDIKNTDFCLD